ncbi:MAG: SEC-C domain-containing protein [Flavobacteriales bacterium]|nr:SEC-C domain-containing protein [Flavobacteriales bacterium]MCB9196363.1 SEC-C domain-containing protein [Flavobacteriales bacterium]MCB9198554.1 SEC-C domain-containing protein [Flavobacteriales bacterium]
MEEQCPCGSGKTYDSCCGVFHNDITKVKTAEQLMRSRYTAFCKANGDYLILSQHSSMIQPTMKYDLVRWAMSVKFMKLEIVDVQDGSEKDETGEVEFNAFYMERFQSRCLHERSRFVKENGHWVYLDAIKD